jgi:hypothetical protein
MDRKQDRTEQDRKHHGRADERENERRDDRRWADEAAKARTAGDPRARTPRDAVGQPSNRSFEE